jgi:DNA uptake protein ComE-like DNA-binding protein
MISAKRGLGYGTTKLALEPVLKQFLIIHTHFHMKNRIFTYLHFTKSERYGTVVLFTLGVLVYLIPELWYWVKPRQHTNFSAFEAEASAFRTGLGTADGTVHSIVNQPTALFYFDPNTADEATLVELGLSEKVAHTIANFRSKGGRFRQAEDFKKIWGLPEAEFERLLPYIQINETTNTAKSISAANTNTQLFAFDPNTATEADFKNLGLPHWTIKSILNFREKGGAFRKPEDFKKIYTLSEADYERLAPFVQISSTPLATAEAPRPVTYSGGTTYVGKPTPKGPIDINRAPVEMWKTLPGIGEGRARQIVNFREKLGGFLSVAQVAETMGLPDSIFQQAKPFLELGSTDLHRLNINTLSAADLEKHPYISKKQADLMVNYREQNGGFRSIQDIEKIIAFKDKAWLAKVKPYLSVE